MYREDEFRILLAVEETVATAAPIPTHQIHSTPANTYCTKGDWPKTIGDI